MYIKEMPVVLDGTFQGVSRLVGLVAKASASRGADPGFGACVFYGDLSGVESYQ